MKGGNRCTECGKFHKWENLKEKYYTNNPLAEEPDFDLLCMECYIPFLKMMRPDLEQFKDNI
jgi:hypothetical protein